MRCRHLKSPDHCRRGHTGWQHLVQSQQETSQGTPDASSWSWLIEGRTGPGYGQSLILKHWPYPRAFGEYNRLDAWSPVWGFPIPLQTCVSRIWGTNLGVSSGRSTYYPSCYVSCIVSMSSHPYLRRRIGRNEPRSVAGECIENVVNMQA